MKTIISITVFFNVLLLSAQNKEGALRFAKKYKAKITFNDFNDSPKFIRFKSTNTLRLEGNGVAEKSLDFLSKNKSLFGIKNIDKDLKLKKVEVDNYNLKHAVFQQEYHGVPVFDGVLKFHYDAHNNLSTINGNLVQASSLNPIPTLSKNNASAKAISFVSKQKKSNSNKPLYVYSSMLYVFQQGLVENTKGNIHLAYQVEVRNNSDIREFVYIDAHSGKVIAQFTGIAHALDRLIYTTKVAPENIVWKEGDEYPGELTQWQKNEVEVSAHVYNFFNNTFGRDSFDASGAQMITVDNDEAVVLNATWNGVHTSFYEGFGTDDIIAHEWGHAYTQYTCGLLYAYEAGSINESLSDIWGETIDLINNYEDEGEDLSLRTSCDNSSRWKIGEDMTLFGVPIDGVRDMWQPSCKENPDKMSDYGCKTIEEDLGGVHYNSGIVNHAYALLVDGGNYNGQTIIGIGLTKAAHIFWRAQTEYLTQTSDFADLAEALIVSATDILGVDLEGLSTTGTASGPSGKVITQSDIVQLQKAIDAVELIKPLKDVCNNYNPILKEIPELCDEATTNPIYKEGWENGLNNWALEQLPVNASTWESRDWEIVSNLPDEKQGKAIFAVNALNGDCKDDIQSGILRLESPAIPINIFNSGNYEMAFTHYIASEFTLSQSDDGATIVKEYVDGGNIKYNLNNSDWLEVPVSAFSHNPYNAKISELDKIDNPLKPQNVFAGTNQGSFEGSWGTSVISLSKLGVNLNDTIKFRFEFGSDGCNGFSGWYIDDIIIYDCEGDLSVSKNTIENLIIYPNPSAGIYNIKSPIHINKATILDVNGRVLNNVKSLGHNTQINLSQYAKGMYFVTFYSNNKKRTFKLIKK